MTDRESLSGFALPVLLISLVVAAGAMAFYGARSAGGFDQRARFQTETALRQARDALIQYAAWEDNSPGALLCPDRNDNPAPEDNNDGKADSCGSDLVVGRVPWKTLGIEPPLDGAGECIWYAISPGARSTSITISSRGSDAGHPALNPGWQGELSVREPGGVRTVIAVLIAPGRRLDGQTRRTGAGPCRDGANSDFLEAADGGDNSTGPQFVSVSARPLFNDQVLTIESDRLFAAVAPRVLIELAGSGEPPLGGLRKLLAGGHSTAEFGPGPTGYASVDFTDPGLQSAFAAPSGISPTVERDCTSYDAIGNFTIEWLCFNQWTQFIRYLPEGPSFATLQLTGWETDLDPLHLPRLRRIAPAATPASP